MKNTREPMYHPSNSNEEDTFRMLKRTPIRELDMEYRLRWSEFYQQRDTFWGWLERHGWTEKEFYEAGKQYEHDMEEHARRQNRVVYYPPVYSMEDPIDPHSGMPV